MKSYVNDEKTDNDICWETGRYNDRCNCSACDHKYECSGSDSDDEEEE